VVSFPREQWAQATRGVTYPWTLLLSIAIGMWLTFTRLTFDSAGAMSDRDHMVGLLVLTFMIIALAEVARATCFINIPFSVWLIALAIPRGKIKDLGSVCCLTVSPWAAPRSDRAFRQERINYGE